MDSFLDGFEKVAVTGILRKAIPAARELGSKYKRLITGAGSREATMAAGMVEGYAKTMGKIPFLGRASRDVIRVVKKDFLSAADALKKRERAARIGTGAVLGAAGIAAGMKLKKPSKDKQD